MLGRVRFLEEPAPVNLQTEDPLDQLAASLERVAALTPSPSPVREVPADRDLMERKSAKAREIARRR